MNSWTADMFYESMICCVCTCMSITANDFSPILSSTTQPDSICLSPHISLYIFVHAKTVAVELSQHAHVHMYIVWYWFWDIYSIHVSECMYTLYVYVDTCIHTYEDERRYAKNPEYVNLECATVYVNPHGGCMKPATETCADGVLLVCTGTLISPSTPWLRFRPAFLTLSPNLSMYSCPQAMLMICCAASREHLWSGACAWCGMFFRSMICKQSMNMYIFQIQMGQKEFLKISGTYRPIVNFGCVTTYFHMHAYTSMRERLLFHT